MRGRTSSDIRFSASDSSPLWKVAFRRRGAFHERGALRVEALPLEAVEPARREEACGPFGTACDLLSRREMKIAVLNAGTGTVKAAVIDVSWEGSEPVWRETVERGHDEPLEIALRAAAERIPRASVEAVSHRVVHGGVEFTRAVVVDAAVENALGRLVQMAPLHNPPALEGIRIAREIFPDVPGIAVFDTAFHAERSLTSRLYALPWDVARSHGLYRYGFHGIAHASLVDSLARSTGCDTRAIDAVTLQLGSSCSACAVQNGCSIETSMGFTPLGGLTMATRSGDIDPAVVFHLSRNGYALDEIETLLNRRSGLLALSGSADMRAVLEAESNRDRRAALAVGVFVRRIVETVGAYLTLLEGRGSIVFGGGIGTHSAEIRRRVAAGLGAWDVALDPDRNHASLPGRISKPGSRGVYVFETEEDRLIARQAASVLRAQR